MANEQISEITTVPTNATVIKIINTLIKRYNSLGSIYTFKGSVQTYAELLAIENPNVGDVYNVVQEDEEHQIAAGSNFVWDGTVWDNLGGSLAGLVKTVNDTPPDDNGNIKLKYVKTVNDTPPDDNGNIKLKYVKTVNDTPPDDNGNIKLKYVKTINKIEPSEDLDVQLPPFFALDAYTLSGHSNIELIPNGADLNSYITSGNYCCQGANDAQSFLNNPYTIGNFRLVVLVNYKGVNGSYGNQILFANNTDNRLYMRAFYGSTPTFTEWQEITKYRRVGGGKDLATLPVGEYFFYGNADTDDAETSLANTDYQGISMRRHGQAVQLVFTGKDWIFRFDDSSEAYENVSYGEWKKILTEADAAGWTISKGTNGWARDPVTGFTIQWGFKDSLVVGDNVISFPRTFTTVYQVVPSFQGAGTYENSGFKENSNPTTKNFTVWVRYGGECRWIATGLS